MSARIDALIETSQQDNFGNTHFLNEDGQIVATFLPAYPTFFVKSIPDSKNSPFDSTGPVALVYEQPITLTKLNGINKFHPSKVAFGAINNLLFKTQVVVVDRPTREFFLVHSYSSVFEQNSPENLLAKDILELMLKK